MSEMEEDHKILTLHEAVTEIMLEEPQRVWTCEDIVERVNVEKYQGRILHYSGNLYSTYIQVGSIQSCLSAKKNILFVRDGDANGWLLSDRAGGTAHIPVIHQEVPVPRVAQDVVLVYDPLVPISIEIIHNGVMRNEHFCWNVDDAQNPSLESFSKSLCDDMEIPADGYVSQVIASIWQQIEAFQPITFAELPESGLLVRIHLEFPVGGNRLFEDEFDYDITSPLGTIESVADTICSDLQLDTSFAAEIAFQMRRKICKAKLKHIQGTLRQSRITNKLTPEDVILSEVSPSPLIKEMDEELAKKFKKDAQRRERARRRSGRYSAAPISVNTPTNPVRIQRQIPIPTFEMVQKKPDKRTSRMKSMHQALQKYRDMHPALEYHQAMKELNNRLKLLGVTFDAYVRGDVNL